MRPSCDDCLNDAITQTYPGQPHSGCAGPCMTCSNFSQSSHLNRSSPEGPNVFGPRPTPSQGAPFHPDLSWGAALPPTTCVNCSTVLPSDPRFPQGQNKGHLSASKWGTLRVPICYSHAQTNKRTTCQNSTFSVILDRNNTIPCFKFLKTICKIKLFCKTIPKRGKCKGEKDPRAEWTTK